MDNETRKALTDALNSNNAQLPAEFKTHNANATRKLMAASSTQLDIPASHKPLEKPEIVHNSETSVSALQDTIAEYATELRRRARAGNITHKDGTLVASLSNAAAKLAAEQREQASQLHLSIASDADIVQLVCDSIVALGPRGVSIFAIAAQRLGLTVVSSSGPNPSPTSTYTKEPPHG